ATSHATAWSTFLPLSLASAAVERHGIGATAPRTTRAPSQVSPVMSNETAAIAMGQSCDCLNFTSYIALFMLRDVGSMISVRSSFGSSTLSPHMLPSALTEKLAAYIYC